ncbi:hypothetical protein HYV88_02875 [Candidatus Woesearchaeota archaeon]|nr:hypothetical protein [Candidatus Woesearchaeota archaeon]
METEQLILKKLEKIEKEVGEIRENMPDKDMFLTSEEELLLEESYDNEKKGNLISSEDLRKELGI